MFRMKEGEFTAQENALSAAKREFEEETGIRPEGPSIQLTPIKQRGGKTVYAWAFEGDCQPDRIRSNMFRMEWPPRSGKVREFPEIDQARFFGIEEATPKINPAQLPLIEELRERLDAR